MTASLNVPNLPETLPALKSGVHIEEGGFDLSGSATWVIHDEKTHEFYHIGWQEHEILSRWSRISPEKLVTKINKASLATVDLTDIIAMLTFLSEQCLIDQPYSAISDVKKRADSHNNGHIVMKLIKHYLFFRVPLVKPERFLTRCYPFLKGLFSQVALLIFFAFALIGIVLMLRQWDQYVNTFFQLFTIKYLILFGIALVIAKSCHELGHALACKRFGLKVPSMGIAFLVMIPMLYTDTGESWKVKSPSDRIIIALAGVWFEFCIAVIALWLWLICPDGVIKSMLFFLSSLSLITTLLINISPFLRFDGYHVLSDILSMRNLQTRSFALAKWSTRFWILGLKENPPELFSPPRRRLLITYAWLTWLYRFVIFLGIAFLIYTVFFKVLGVILFVIELLYFIVLPIYRELKVWWHKRESLTLNPHAGLSLIIFILLLFVLFFPWSSSISIPATLSYQQQTLHTQYPARIQKIRVTQGEAVEKNMPLVTLYSPALNFELASLKLRGEQALWEMRNYMTKGVKRHLVSELQAKLNTVNTQIKALEDLQKRLVIRSPMNGKIAQLARGLKPGVMIGTRQALIRMINLNKPVISGFSTASDIDKISTGQTGRFIPDNTDYPRIKVRVTQSGASATTRLSLNPQNKKWLSMMSESVALSAYHVSDFGGDIAARVAEEDTYKPEKSVYHVRFRATKPIPPVNAVLRGVVSLNVGHYSLIHRLWRSVIRTLRLESSF
jgi:putative peptide zinc metalloprotease protein